MVNFFMPVALNVQKASGQVFSALDNVVGRLPSSVPPWQLSGFRSWDDTFSHIPVLSSPTKILGSPARLLSL